MLNTTQQPVQGRRRAYEITLLEFLNIVLARLAWRCIAVKLPNGHFKHFWFNDNDQVAEAIAYHVNLGRDVWIAIANYLIPEVRKGINAAFLRCIIADLDVGPESYKYGSQRDALIALCGFCKAFSLPLPLVVSSGTGIQVWWPLTADLTAAEWRILAELFKAVAKAWGFKADPSRTSDVASLLRPTGTLNHKTDPAREVYLVNKGDGPIDADQMRQALESFKASTGKTSESVNVVLPPGGPVRAIPVESDLSAGISRGSWFGDLAPEQKDRCLAYLLTSPSVIAAADASYPEWFPVVAACARSGAPSAREICRSWSMGSAKYEAAAFDKTFNSFEADHVGH